MKLKDTKSRPGPPSRGTFQTKGIRVVGKWKQVKIDPNLFADGQMDDLVCFEELTDYRLVSPAKNPSGFFSNEEPKKRKAQAVSEDEEEGEAGEEGESSSPKKKMKLKKQKAAVEAAEGSTAQDEAKDSGPETQAPVTVRSDRKVGEAASESLAQAVQRKKKNKGKKKVKPFPQHCL